MDTSDLGLLLLRVVIGLTFAAHGAQKLFGWWGGAGWDGWQAVMVRLGFRPPALFAAVSVAAEVGGGLLFAVGFLTPLAGLVLIGQEVVIIAKSHWSRGFWNRDNGFEFPLALFAGTVAIVLAGPGAASVDGQLEIDADSALRIGLVALGILGGLATAGLREMVRRDDAAAARR
jgi:putative oxidoreductase